MERTNIDYNPYKDHRRAESRKKKVVKWYDKLICKKVKKGDKTKNIQIEREDET